MACTFYQAGFRDTGQPPLAVTSGLVEAEVSGTGASLGRRVSLLSVHFDPISASPGDAGRLAGQGSGQDEGREARASWPCVGDVPGKTQDDADAIRQRLLLHTYRGAPKSVAMGTAGPAKAQLIKIPSDMQG